MLALVLYHENSTACSSLNGDGYTASTYTLSTPHNGYTSPQTLLQSFYVGTYTGNHNTNLVS